MKNIVVKNRIRIYLILSVILALALFVTGCTGLGGDTDNTVPVPHTVIKPVADAVLLAIESTDAKSILGEAASDTRLDFRSSAVKFYKTQGEFTDEQAEKMVDTLFEAIDKNIKYDISEAVYRDEKTAFVDVLIYSVDQKDFAKRSKEYLDNNINPEEYELLSEPEKAKYSYEAFIACCEQIKMSAPPTKVTAKLLKYSTGWQIDNAIDFVLNLLTAYTGSAQ